MGLAMQPKESAGSHPLRLSSSVSDHQTLSALSNPASATSGQRSCGDFLFVKSSRQACAVMSHDGNGTGLGTQAAAKRWADGCSTLHTAKVKQHQSQWRSTD